MRRVLYAVTLCLTLVCIGCGMSETKESALRATGDFRVKYEQGKYDAIWATTSPEFRKAMTQAEFTKFLQKIHEKLGSTVDVNLGPFNVNYGTAGTIVTLGYQTKFQKGDAAETFIWRIDEGQAQLVGYNVNSKALILN
jgi:uncharacterized cupin superfamily protein